MLATLLGKTKICRTAANELGEAVAFVLCDWVAKYLDRGNPVAIRDGPEGCFYFALSNVPSVACQAFLQCRQTNAI